MHPIIIIVIVSSCLTVSLRLKQTLLHISGLICSKSHCDLDLDRHKSNTSHFISNKETSGHPSIVIYTRLSQSGHQPKPQSGVMKKTVFITKVLRQSELMVYIMFCFPGVFRPDSSVDSLHLGTKFATTFSSGVVLFHTESNEPNPLENLIPSSPVGALHQESSKETTQKSQKKTQSTTSFIMK